MTRRYRVALSYPSEYREYVGTVADTLGEALGRERIFFDCWYAHDLARTDLDTYLQRIYREESDLIVPFLCAEYQCKQWCGREWRAIRDVLGTPDGHNIMPMRFDHAQIPGFFGIDGYVSLEDLNPQDAAGLILKRLADFPDSPEPAPRAASPLDADSAAGPDTLGKLLERVRRIVDERLSRPAEALPLLPLRKSRCDGAVENPADRLADRSRSGDQAIPAERTPAAIFREAHRSLLILGGTGSGKTTTLLELARELADTSTAPPALVNLSSWSPRENRFESWLSRSIGEIYQLPVSYCQAWLKDNRLILLLDGLDEVERDHRAACAETINAYVAERGSGPGIAVACRDPEYQTVGVKLKLFAAFRLEPLSHAQVESCLQEAGDRLSALRAVLATDPDFRSFAANPFILDIFCRAYTGSDNLPTAQLETAESGRNRLFDIYIRRCLEHRPATERPYTASQYVGFLGTVARNLLTHCQSEFLVERLQPDWLPSRRLSWLYVAVSRLLVIAPVLIVFALLPSELVFQANPALGVSSDQYAHTANLAVWLAMLLIVLVDGLRLRATAKRSASPAARPLWQSILWIGLFTLTVTALTKMLTIGSAYIVAIGLGFALGLIFIRRSCGVDAGKDIHAADTLAWSTRGALNGVARGVALALLFIALIAGLVLHHMGIFANPALSSSPDFWLRLLAALANQPVLAAVLLLSIEMGILLGGLRARILSRATVPNQGIRSCVSNAALAAAITSSMAAFNSVVAWLWVPAWRPLILPFWFLSLFAAIWHRAQDAVYHGVLRLILSASGVLPHRLLRFLDHAAGLGLLRKAGGGYEFLHRSLLEHFAAAADAGGLRRDG